MFFTNKATSASSSISDFGYLAPDACYMDAACQTLRPTVVIDAETEYYTQYNACGGRVKYKWGEMVDRKVGDAREGLLSYAGKRAPEYRAIFSLNTTYGINLVLHQLPSKRFTRIVTSEIEHNSVFLPTITWAKRNNADRIVLPRDDDGNLMYQPSDLQDAVVIVNSMSNIDGRILKNIKDLAQDTHAAGGIVLIDGAQGFGHDIERLRDTDYDAAFGSGHKMYGPSMGFIIIKEDLLHSLDPFFLGGGTVDDVTRDAFVLQTSDEAHAVLEPGLQNWSGILGLHKAIEWLSHQKKDHETILAQILFNVLKDQPRVTMLNKEPSSVISFYVDTIDAHTLALYLSQQNIMCRSGHFCCHAYLNHQLHLPPLLRVSLGLYNTEEHIAHFEKTLTTILTTL
jgi:cysteine desulfurase/selenocysteine lyase